MLWNHKSEGSSPHDQMTCDFKLQRCCSFNASCCFVFSSETMEKLLKREKEVSTLTSQVEALKSQMAGKCQRLHNKSSSRELSQPLPSFLSKSLVSESLNLQRARSFSLQLVFTRHVGTGVSWLQFCCSGSGSEDVTHVLFGEASEMKTHSLTSVRQEILTRRIILIYLKLFT